jgi:hypothetical protein
MDLENINMDSQKKNILDEIKKSGAGFSEPKGYFEDMEDRLVVNLSLDKAKKVQSKSAELIMHKLKPNKLDVIGKSHGFTTPAGYLDEDVKQLIIPRTKKINSLNYLGLSKWLNLSIAASILLFIGLGFYLSRNTNIKMAELNTDEIENWIDTDLVSFNSFEIAELFEDVELESDLYSDEEVEAYLDNIDIENIILDN